MTDSKPEIALRVADRFRQAADGDFKSMEARIRQLLGAVKIANDTRKVITTLLETVPNDTSAQRMAKDCEAVIKRLEKEIEDLRKKARAVSEKAVPPELKKLAADVAKLVRAQLVDPKKLQIIPWHIDVYVVPPGYGRGSNETFPSIILRITDPGLGYEKSQSVTVFKHPHLGLAVAQGYASPEAAPSAKVVAEKLVKSLGTWDGVKGLGDQRAKWMETAMQIKPLLETVLRRLGSDADRVEVSDDGRTISGAYRSGLPKDGDRGIDEYRYEEMRKAEYARADKALDAVLGHMKSKIDDISRTTGDKGWISIDIRLK